MCQQCVNTGSSPKMVHVQTCPPPDVVAVMTQQPASPPDVYSIAVITKSLSKVVTGQISHDKIYYGQMIKLQKSELPKYPTLH
jgi:hypothetical protein